MEKVKQVTYDDGGRDIDIKEFIFRICSGESPPILVIQTHDTDCGEGLLPTKDGYNRHFEILVQDVIKQLIDKGYITVSQVNLKKLAP